MGSVYLIPSPRSNPAPAPPVERPLLADVFRPVTADIERTAKRLRIPAPPGAVEKGVLSPHGHWWHRQPQTAPARRRKWLNRLAWEVTQDRQTLDALAAFLAPWEVHFVRHTIRNRAEYLSRRDFGQAAGLASGKARAQKAGERAKAALSQRSMGATVSEIADTLGVSERAVYRYLADPRYRAPKQADTNESIRFRYIQRTEKESTNPLSLSLSPTTTNTIRTNVRTNTDTNSGVFLCEQGDFVATVERRATPQLERSAERYDSGWRDVIRDYAQHRYGDMLPALRRAGQSPAEVRAMFLAFDAESGGAT